MPVFGRERDHHAGRGDAHPPAVISVNQLSKTYASGFRALKSVDLEIRRGEIFALLGPNGAGKTTLISVICGIVRPSAGRIEVDGHDIVTDYHVKAKKLVALGVTSLKRQPSLPDLPAIAEFSPGFEATSWWGLVAPRATPRAVIASLNGQVVKALDSADMKTFMNSVGAEPAPTTPEAFDAFARAERIKWARVVKESGARAE